MTESVLDMPKKILIVANSDWLLYQFRLPLLRALKMEGLELALICPEGENTNRLQELGYQVLPWNMQRMSISPIKVIRALAELIGYYRRFQPDAVHHITIQSIFYGSIAAKLTAIPVVINNFTGLGYIFSQARKAFWMRMIILPILRWAFAGERIYTVLLNNHDREELLARELIREEYSQVISSDGVDLTRFHPAEGGSNGPDGMVVLMASRLLWDKGVAEYVQAAEEIRSKNQEVQFWLAGAPDPGNPTSIPPEQIQEWKDQDVIEVLGYRTDMPSLLWEADIAVLPSYHEGVPVFLLEAAATGLPLISTNLEGCRMVVREGENGFLIPTGDWKALSDALQKLITDPGLRKKMGERSREIVEARYSQELIVSQFLHLYRKLGVLPENSQL